jgi:hypothetical protein
MRPGRSLPPGRARYRRRQEGDAFNWFKELDDDNSGTLDLVEVQQLAIKLNLQMTKNQLNKAFVEMVRPRPGTPRFERAARGVEVLTGVVGLRLLRTRTRTTQSRTRSSPPGAAKHSNIQTFSRGPRAIPRGAVRAFHSETAIERKGGAVG